jgi:hypothetical protein
LLASLLGSVREPGFTEKCVLLFLFMNSLVWNLLVCLRMTQVRVEICSKDINSKIKQMLTW